MSDQPNLKYRIVSTVQKHILNRVARHLPITTLETIGRKSGVPRRTPVGGRVIDNAFWMVSEHGNRAQYVKNIQANPSVRMRIRGRWRSGTAHLLPDDDPIERLKQLPGGNSALVRLMGSDLLTVRVDLD
jgi:deazaflavin-dependent oxidoreductase (nitroreductase family)